MSFFNRLTVVVGGQFGSEAKGHVADRLIRRAQHEDRTVQNVRVAGPNAGHTVVDEEGTRFAFRQLPVGAVNPAVSLVIAAGSEIDLPVLVAEIAAVIAAGYELDGRLQIDPEATLLEAIHHRTDERLIERIGSTGKGIGAARSDRIMRQAKRLADEPLYIQRLEDLGAYIAPYELPQPPSVDQQTEIVVEGTQGYGLGLHAGFYHQCTSSDCRAIDFLAMAGISPWDHSLDWRATQVWMAIRPFPIRVAGNSGPLKDETTWEELGLEREITTVTKKVRRVGRWDGELVARAVAANGGAPTVRLAFTMLDQIAPEFLGMSERPAWEDLQRLRKMLAFYEEDADARIGLVTTSDRTGFFL